MHRAVFQNLAQKYQQAEQKDREFRQRVAQIIDLSQLKEFSRSRRAVTLVAANKAFAQELFLRKEAIQNALACEVIIH